MSASEEDPKPKKVRLREFAGLVNRSKEILIPVCFSSHEDGVTFLPIQKNVAKMLIDEAKELGLDCIEGVVEGTGEDEGCLYLEGPEEGEEGVESEAAEEEPLEGDEE